MSIAQTNTGPHRNVTTRVPTSWSIMLLLIFITRLTIQPEEPPSFLSRSVLLNSVVHSQLGLHCGMCFNFLLPHTALHPACDQPPICFPIQIHPNSQSLCSRIKDPLALQALRINIAYFCGSSDWILRSALNPPSQPLEKDQICHSPMFLVTSFRFTRWQRKKFCSFRYLHFSNLLGIHIPLPSV